MVLSSPHAVNILCSLHVRLVQNSQFLAVHASVTKDSQHFVQRYIRAYGQQW
jgi:hypothetical protein